jgi:hypothetical protein
LLLKSNSTQTREKGRLRAEEVNNWQIICTTRFRPRRRIDLPLLRIPAWQIREGEVVPGIAKVLKNLNTTEPVVRTISLLRSRRAIR